MKYLIGDSAIQLLIPVMNSKKSINANIKITFSILNKKVPAPRFELGTPRVQHWLAKLHPNPLWER